MHRDVANESCLLWGDLPPLKMFGLEPALSTRPPHLVFIGVEGWPHGCLSVAIPPVLLLAKLALHLCRSLVQLVFLVVGRDPLRLIDLVTHPEDATPTNSVSERRATILGRLLPLILYFFNLEMYIFIYYF